ncbi:MAG: hypothetical protein GF311_05825 [Candidatus Lokiarchaeota archaeon]|nr:hypothetical protein [Candidatus Lokiarchaeota archaeon]
MKLEIQDLKHLFEKEICVRYIYENLISCDSSQENYKKKAISYMIDKDFDLLGFKENDKIDKYIDKKGRNSSNRDKGYNLRGNSPK